MTEHYLYSWWLMFTIVQRHVDSDSELEKTLRKADECLMKLRVCLSSLYLVHYSLEILIEEKTRQCNCDGKGRRV